MRPNADAWHSVLQGAVDAGRADIVAKLTRAMEAQRVQITDQKLQRAVLQIGRNNQDGS